MNLGANRAQYLAAYLRAPQPLGHGVRRSRDAQLKRHADVDPNMVATGDTLSAHQLDVDRFVGDVDQLGRCKTGIAMPR